MSAAPLVVTGRQTRKTVTAGGPIEKQKNEENAILKIQPHARASRPGRAIVILGTVLTTISLAYAIPQARSKWFQRREAIAIQGLSDHGIPYAAGDAAEYRRQEYMMILTNLHRVATIYGDREQQSLEPAKLSGQRAAESAMEIVMSASHAELSLMIEYQPDLGPLLRATDRLLAVAEQDAVMSQAMNHGGNSGVAPSPHGGALNSGGLPDAPYSDEYGSERPTTAAIIAASGVYEAAETTRDIASRGCEQVAVAIGAGGNTSSVCIAVDAVFVAAKLVWWDINNWDNDVAGAEIAGNYLRLGHLHGDIESHDNGIRVRLQEHDDSMVSRVGQHDSNMEGKVLAHDQNMSLVVGNHNTEITGQLGTHDLNVRDELHTHDVAVRNALGQTQQTLDERVEQRKVVLQAFMLWDAREYLIVCTESGEPIDVQFTAIESYDRTQNAFVPCAAAQVLPAGGGAYKIRLNPSGPVYSEVYRVRVGCNDGLGHSGQLFFPRQAKG